MPRFSANISTLFRGLDMPAGIARAAACGFDAIELQFPYDEDPEALRTALDRAGLPLVLMNFPAGDLLQGGLGLAGVPGRQAAFSRALANAIRHIEILRPRSINLLSGRAATQQTQATGLQLFREQLLQAAEITQPAGIQLLVEAVNTIDLPGFLVSDTRTAISLIHDLPQIDLRLQYDCYHMTLMEDHPLVRLPQVMDYIGHIQFSDVPGRTEPGLGSLDFDALFELIDTLGYDGWVGAEYFPTVAAEQTLGWMRAQR